ncbi:hypothetical protein K432DRAFT_381249 [Lepidopterella palustris CBS 459.81]|uniref:DUF2231 domain-containing protein n=1 Tax=Lepidopterella palustris CBS 459.81 TaxID=1314670 RepID=A0A8E2ECM6_9PEZI|nr:hypothetical protein K432DRAFT_381249 [Lepidopterella palustris CBS 459.81]
MGNRPIHPATVHFPITFITLSSFLDIFSVAATHPTTAPFIGSALKSLDLQLHLAAIPQFSYYIGILALITAVPAVITGALELKPLIDRDGPFGTPKARAGVAHALLNDIAIGGLAYNWWTRRAVDGFEPSTLNLAISGALALPAVSLAAFFGGSLVYGYGMGMSMGSGKGKGKKTQ